MNTIKLFLISLLVFTSVFIFQSCDSPDINEVAVEECLSLEKTAKQSVSDFNIDTLYKGNIRNGIYKIDLDSSEYLLVVDSDGVGLIKHK